MGKLSDKMAAAVVEKEAPPVTISAPRPALSSIPGDRDENWLLALGLNTRFLCGMHWTGFEAIWLDQWQVIEKKGRYVKINKLSQSSSVGNFITWQWVDSVQFSKNFSFKDKW